MTPRHSSCLPEGPPLGRTSLESSSSAADAVPTAAPEAVAAETEAEAARVAEDATALPHHQPGLKVQRKGSIELPSPGDVEGPLRSPPVSSASRFVAAATAASAPSSSAGSRTEAIRAPQGGSPAPELEVPLFLLQQDTECGSGGVPGALPQGGDADIGDEWHHDVSSSVAAAFRDLQSNMHVRSSNSRAMRIGLGDVLLHGDLDASHPVRGDPQVGPLGPAAPAAASCHSPRQQLGASDVEPSEGSSGQGPPVHRAQEVAPPGAPLSTHANCRGTSGASPGALPTSAEAGVADGSSPSAVDIQTEFLSAYNIPPLRAAAIAEAAEAAAEAEAAAGATIAVTIGSAAAVSRKKAEAIPLTATSSSVSSGSLGARHQSDQGGTQEGPQGPLGQMQPIGEAQPSPSAAKWSRNFFRRQSGGINRACPRESLQRSNTSLSGRAPVKNFGSDRANVPGVFPVGVRGRSQKNSQALSPVWCVREVETGDRAALWSATISPKGEWLAAAGQTGVVFLWSVPGLRIPGGPRGIPETPGGHSKDSKQKSPRRQNPAEGTPTGASQPTSRPTASGSVPAPNDGHSGTPCGRLSSEAPARSAGAGDTLGSPMGTPKRGFFLKDRPDLCLTGHGASVIFLTWAPTTKMSLLLSASLDKTVRLWRPSKGIAAIAVLRCTDWPTSASFHPIFKDVIFTGCLDATIQVWRLLSTRTPGTPGTSRSTPEQFESRIVEYLKTLKFRSEVDCKNRKGKFAKGRKVTSLEWLPDGSCLCVATNDSRIRIFDVMSLTCIYKFKGHINSQIMLKASYTFGGLGVVCGSEFGRICYWRVSGPGGESFYHKARLATWKRVTNTSFEDFKAPQPFSASLLSYISLHQLPPRGPPAGRGTPSLRGPPQAYHQQQQQHPQQHSEAAPIGAVRVYGDGQTVTSIAGGSPSFGPLAPGGPQPGGLATRRSKLKSMLSLGRGLATGAPRGPPPLGSSSGGQPKFLSRAPSLGQSEPSLACSSGSVGGPSSSGGAPGGAALEGPPPASPAAVAAAFGRLPSYSSDVGSSPPPAAPTEATAAANEAAAAAADGEPLCDSDDSDWCAASLAAMSVADSVPGGGPRGSLEGRPLCWRAGNRLHLGLPPENFSLCKEQSEAANLVVVAGSYNGKIRIFVNLAGVLTPKS